MKVEKKSNTGWKVLTSDKKSFKDEGAHTWKKGEWYKVEGDLKICINGFHCSKTIAEAIWNFAPGLLCKIEAQGENIKEMYIECWRNMRVVEEYEWTHEMTVKLAIFAVRLVLPVWVKEFPEDDRPLKAIEAAEKWLKEPTEKNRAAVRFAHAAADAAAAAAVYAAYAAKAAVYAVRFASAAVTEVEITEKCQAYAESLLSR